MKSKALIGLIGLAAALSAENYPGNPSPKPTKKESEEERKKAERTYKKNLAAKGVQEFVIDGYTVYARDYKNALRKVNNLKKL